MSETPTISFKWYTAPDGEHRYLGPTELRFEDGTRVVSESVHTTRAGMTSMRTEWFIISPEGLRTKTTQAGLLALASMPPKRPAQNLWAKIKGLFA